MSSGLEYYIINQINISTELRGREEFTLSTSWLKKGLPTWTLRVTGVFEYNIELNNLI